MSFMTDLFEGNFSNLGHDLTSHFKEDLPYWGAAAATALTGGLAGGLFGGLGAAEAGVGALGAAEGGSALLGGGEALGGSALGFAGEAGAAGGEGLGAIDAALGAGGTVGGEAAPLGIDYASSVVPGATNSIENLLPETANAAGGGGAGGSGGGGVSSFFSKLGTGAVDSVTKNPLGIGAAAVGLGMNIFKGNPDDPNKQKLQGQADQLGAQGQALQQYLANGTLPPAMQASLNEATAAAKARIVANHAKNGMSTDPTQNSALAQELSAVDTNAVGAMASAQIEMMKTGLNATGLSSQLYEMLTKMDRQNNQDLMSAIQSFASALGGGGGKTINLKAA